MAVRFDAESEAYTATTGLPAGTVYTVTCWLWLAVDRDAKSAAWVLADTATPDAATANTILGTQANGTTLELESFTAGAVGSALGVGAWHKVGVVINGATAQLYTAAAADALVLTSTSSFTPPATNGGLWIGRSAWTGEWFNGRVASWKMWAAALTQGEIETELATWVAARTANLLRNHKFQTAETTDYSGNGNTLAGGTGASTEADPPITAMERAAPDAILAQTGLTGAVTAIQDDPDSPDGSWLVA